MALVPPPGPARTLAGAILVTTVGNGAFITASTLYFTRAVGLPPVAVGLGLTAGGIAGLCAGVPFGHLADLLGPRNVTAALTALTGACTAAYLFVGSKGAFVAVAVAFALADRGGYAARQALIARVVAGDELVQVRAYLRSVTNIGVAVGAALAGIAVQLDTAAAYRTALGLDALSFLACALVFAHLPATPPLQPGPAEDDAGPGGGGATARPARASMFAVTRDRMYVALTGANMLLLLHAPLLEVVLPLWITRHTAAPRALVSVLILVNTAAVVLLQVRLSRGIDSLGAAAGALRRAGLVLAVACLVFATSAAGPVWLAVAVLLAGAALHVTGEMLQAAGAWMVSYDLAPPERMGQYQGLFNTGAGAAQQLAPALLIVLVVEWGAPGWLVLAGLFVAGAVITSALVGRAERRAALAAA